MRLRTALMLALYASVLAGGIALVQRAMAYPQPAIVSKAWQLDFEHSEPKPVAVKGIDGKYAWYWYITYQVTNHTGSDQLWLPQFTVATDAGDIVTAGDHIPASVYVAIEEKEHKRFMVSPVKVVGKILQGEDFAKESAAIWKAFDHDVDHVDVFVAGLSGETVAVELPRTRAEKVADELHAAREEAKRAKEKAAEEAAAAGDEKLEVVAPVIDPNKPQPGPQRVVLRKTLMLKYATPGDMTSPQSQSVEALGEEWIMR